MFSVYVFYYEFDLSYSPLVHVTISITISLVVYNYYLHEVYSNLYLAVTCVADIEDCQHEQQMRISTHFWAMFPFYTPCEHQKFKGWYNHHHIWLTTFVLNMPVNMIGNFPKDFEKIILNEKQKKLLQVLLTTSILKKRIIKGNGEIKQGKLIFWTSSKMNLSRIPSLQLSVFFTLGIHT